MTHRLTSLGMGLALALVPTSLVVADVVQRATLVDSLIPLAVLGVLPAIAGGVAASWVQTGRTRAERAGRGFLVGLIPMLGVAAACLVVVNLNGPATAAWMLVLAVMLALVQAGVGAIAGALLPRSSS